VISLPCAWRSNGTPPASICFSRAPPIPVHHSADLLFPTIAAYFVSTLLLSSFLPPPIGSFSLKLQTQLTRGRGWTTKGDGNSDNFFFASRMNIFWLAMHHADELLYAPGAYFFEARGQAWELAHP